VKFDAGRICLDRQSAQVPSHCRKYCIFGSRTLPGHELHLDRLWSLLTTASTNHSDLTDLNHL
jgi:hypothetical protein